MESRFSKYETGNRSQSEQIASINNYIDWNYDKGLEVIEKEINALQRKIDGGNAPAIFGQKVNHLISLGKSIEQLHETYYFNKGNNNNSSLLN